MRNNKNLTNQSTNSPSFFDDFFTRDLLKIPISNGATFSMPKVNIQENDDAFLVEMAVPGMKKSDFKVELNHNELIISVDKKKDEKGGNENISFLVCEFNYGKFMRKFMLPRDVVAFDQIKAKYEAGILYILIPKKEEARNLPPKEIKIS